MKSLMRLLREVLLDRGTWCNVSTTLDFKTIERRVKDEGVSFLTITLPVLGQDLQKGLDLGQIDPTFFRGFPKKAKAPLLLGGFFDLIFDRNNGSLLEFPDSDAIQAIRQISLMFAKIDLPCTERRTRAAIQKYIQCELDVRSVDKSFNKNDSNMESFRRISTMLWDEPLQNMDRLVYEGALVPKHGPGATADRLRGNAKFKQSEWTSRLEYYFPHGEYLAPSWRYFIDLQHVDIREPGSERPVRVITVPKTLKTPRIIAIEPTCMQYTQQALLEPLVRLLQRKDFLCSHFVGFDDQTRNQSMAQNGSILGNVATLDLSEASDRVSNQHVRNLVHLWPHFGAALDATRSRKADVPGYGVLRLAKYASMGSALCFPVEAMVFLTIIFVGIETKLRRRLTRKDIQAFSGSVHVYGDDIIVPVDFVSDVIAKLEAFGLLVNRDKSFWTGKFRESCGKEYFDGTDVSIVRVRRMIPTSHRSTPEFVSLVSLRNQFYKAGYWGVTKFLDEKIRGLTPFFPNVEETSSVLGRHSFLGFDSEKESVQLQIPLVRGHVVDVTLPSSILDGHSALLKYFLKRGDEPYLDPKHLERYGRPQSVHTKLRWASPY
jgi:hypothetical protein